MRCGAIGEADCVSSEWGVGRMFDIRWSGAYASSVEYGRMASVVSAYCHLLAGVGNLGDSAVGSRADSTESVLTNLKENIL